MVLALVERRVEAEEAPSDEEAFSRAGALVAVYPEYLTPEIASAHISAAQDAVASLEPPNQIDVALLLAVAYIESRFDGSSVSRLVCDAEQNCSRKTGRVAGSAKPKNARGPYFCGALQVKAGSSWAKCRSFASDLTATYAKAVEEFVDWWGYCQRYRRDEDKRLRCALLGHGGGWNLIEAGMARGSSTKGSAGYPNRCLLHARKIRRAFALPSS
jgi:hypothetical protein